MPRSPAEGAATRSVADLEIGSARPSRDRRVRSGADRRQRNLGAPNGIERRRVDRRSHDRRSGMRSDRRRSERRHGESRRAAADHRVAVSRRTQAARVATRSYDASSFPATRTPRLLRVVIITIVAVACLLAATLTGPIGDARGAAAPKKAKTGVVKAKSGAVSASLSYEQKKRSGSLKVYGKLRLTVRAAGRTTLKSVKLTGEAREGWATRPKVTLSDVTGDGTPDAIVEIYTGGAHCCSVAAVASSTESGWAAPVNRNWADYGFELRELGGTPQVEFKSWDQRFTGAYGPYAASRTPLQIFRLVGGVYTDVTREFPDWIKQDETQKAKDWQEASTLEADIRGLAGRSAAAAWIADLLLLDRVAEAKAVVEASAARGDFNDEAGKAFPGQLGHDLKAWGYLTDPTTIGLTDSPAPLPTTP